MTGWEKVKPPPVSTTGKCGRGAKEIRIKVRCELMRVREFVPLGVLCVRCVSDAAVAYSNGA